MIGLTIFSHSLRQVLGNMGMAVRISWWLVAIVGVVWLVASMTLPAPVMLALQGVQVQPEDLDGISGGAALLGLLALLVFFVFVLWAVSLIAIVWHRYILLEEMPRGGIPYRPEFRVGRYFWVGVGIALIALLVVAVVSGFIGMITGPFFLSSLEAAGQSGGTAPILGLAFLLAILTGLVMAVLYLRLALVLPAIALDEGLSIGKAWEVTSGYSGAIFVLALVMAFLNVVVPMVVEGVGDALLPVWMTGLLLMAYNWFYFMLNISILSTLYGHIVQKREVY